MCRSNLVMPGMGWNFCLVSFASREKIYLEVGFFCVRDDNVYDDDRCIFFYKESAMKENVIKVMFE